MVTNVIYPQKAFINDITNAQNAVVTFTEAHDFTLGEIVSFRVGKAFGMDEINNHNGRVLAFDSTTITVDIDTSFWSSFDYSVLDDPGTTPPVCVPVGSGKIPSTNPQKINQQDAFDNRRS